MNFYKRTGSLHCGQGQRLSLGFISDSKNLQRVNLYSVAKGKAAGVKGTLGLDITWAAFPSKY